MLFRSLEKQAKVAQTDAGVELQALVNDLMDLLSAYRAGLVSEDHK